MHIADIYGLFDINCRMLSQQAIVGAWRASVCVAGSTEVTAYISEYSDAHYRHTLRLHSTRSLHICHWDCSGIHGSDSFPSITNVSWLPVLDRTDCPRWGLMSELIHVKEHAHPIGCSAINNTNQSQIIQGLFPGGGSLSH